MFNTIFKCFIATCVLTVIFHTYLYYWQLEEVWMYFHGLESFPELPIVNSGGSFSIEILQSSRDTLENVKTTNTINRLKICDQNTLVT